MGSSRSPRMRRRPVPATRSLLLSTSTLLLLLHTTHGARIFRSPEPHLPAENLSAPPSPTEHRSYEPEAPPAADASAPRSAGDPGDYFAPGAWRPVRDPDISGRRRISPLAASGLGSDPHIASARNLRHEDGAVKVSSDARTSEPSSADTSTPLLGHSIALVANQLLQSKADILESHIPEISATGSLKDEHWPHTSLDMRTPPKLMLQISGQKNTASGEDTNKRVVPIQDDPMGENFFPSRRQPTTVTQQTPTTPGQIVTQMTVSTIKKNQPKDSDHKPPSSTPENTKLDKRPVTPPSMTPNNVRKSPATVSSFTRTSTSAPSTAASTAYSSATSPQLSTTTSVKWKIAIPPNRQATRFPPRKPITTTTTASPANSYTESMKESKPSSAGTSNPRPNTSGFTKPVTVLGTSRRPIPTITRITTTTPNPAATTTPRPTAAAVSHASFTPTSRPPVTTTVQQPARSTTPRPTAPTTSHPVIPSVKQPTPIKQAPNTATTSVPKKESAVIVQAKKPLLTEKEVTKEPITAEVLKATASTKTESTTTSPSSSTTRPRRPSNKRKKNKNRRRRPSKKPATSTQAATAPSSGTELEVKETPQEDGAGNVASPLSTRIYNFIAREVMPSVSVGLLGLVVTAGLAGYFLLPTLGLQRRSDMATDGIIPGYGSSGSYGTGQDEDGGIVKTIFQNVMASVTNGEEFERGPRRRRSTHPTNDLENEIDANLHVQDVNQNWKHTNSVTMTTTVTPDVIADSTTENTDGVTTGKEIDVETTTKLSDGVVEDQAVTEEGTKTDNPSQDLTPINGWEGEYYDHPLSLMGILRRIAEFKIRLGVGLLRATTDVIARYLEDVQQRLRDSDKQDWLRNLESAVRRIQRSIDTPSSDAEEDKSIPHPRARFSRHRRTRRHG